MPESAAQSHSAATSSDSANSEFAISGIEDSDDSIVMLEPGTTVEEYMAQQEAEKADAKTAIETADDDRNSADGEDESTDVGSDEESAGQTESSAETDYGAYIIAGVVGCVIIAAAIVVYSKKKSGKS